MSEVIEKADLFELELELPNAELTATSKGLVGFESRYQRLYRDLRLLSDPEEVRAWSRKYYQKELAIGAALSNRYPLVIFAGDVGTGKTVTAECACDRLAREARRETMLFKLSTRVRGSGKVGQMSTLLNQAFDTVTKQAGKARHAFLIVDEGDSLAAARDTVQSHHEDKVAVNTIIQKVDDLRRHSGRVLVFLCTNRAGALDPAIVRRAARIEQFDRPTDQEREALLRLVVRALRSLICARDYCRMRFAARFRHGLWVAMIFFRRLKKCAHPLRYKIYDTALNSSGFIDGRKSRSWPSDSDSRFSKRQN
jgi:hypothetical protein